MANTNSNNTNNKGNKKYKITIGVMAVIILLLGTMSTILLSERHANAATFDEVTTETEYGPVWAEQILDGSGRYILHIEHRDGVVADYLACELSYDMTFGDGWVVGAEMNDETTEVVYGQPGDTIYVRFQNEDGDYMIYPIILPGETPEVKEVVEVEVPVATETAAKTNTKPATKEAQNTQNTTATQTQNQTTNNTNTTTKDNSSETNRKVVNEEIVNRKVVNEEVVNPVTETGYVYVSYVDENGSKLSSTLEISGSIGVSYSTEKKSFDGYNYVSVDGNATGKIAKNTQYVVYNYEKAEKEMDKPEVTEKGFVYVSYVDENGTKLASTLEISGNIGVSYSTEQKSFDGYEFVSVDGLADGTISKEVAYVTYNYKKVVAEEPETPVVEMGKVIVSYVTEDGTKLVDDVVIEGEIGTSYVADQKSFDGYELVSVDGATNGTINKESVVRFVYAAVVEEEHVHNYFVIEAAEAKCLTDGYVTYGCECGDSYTEIIAAHGHSMKTYAVTEEYIEEHCMECGFINMIYADIIEDATDATVVVDVDGTVVIEDTTIVVDEDAAVVVDAEEIVADEDAVVVDAEEIVDTQ